MSTSKTLPLSSPPPTVYRDPKTGRFKRAWRLSSKGYPRFHIKRYRDRYVHIVMMEYYLGRKLRRDEDVDHRNGRRTDWSKGNLRVLDHSVHGFVSNKQKWWVTHVIEPKRKREWEEYFGAGAAEIMVESDSQGCGEDCGGVDFSFGANAYADDAAYD